MYKTGSSPSCVFPFFAYFGAIFPQMHAARRIRQAAAGSGPESRRACRGGMTRGTAAGGQLRTLPHKSAARVPTHCRLPTREAYPDVPGGALSRTITTWARQPWQDTLPLACCASCYILEAEGLNLSRLCLMILASNRTFFRLSAEDWLDHDKIVSDIPLPLTTPQGFPTARRVPRRWACSGLKVLQQPVLCVLMGAASETLCCALGHAAFSASPTQTHLLRENLAPSKHTHIRKRKQQPPTRA